MSVELIRKFAPYTDELFKAESKKSLADFDWTGAHTVMVWKISTVGLNDYSRNRYGVDLMMEVYRAFHNLVNYMI